MFDGRKGTRWCIGKGEMSRGRGRVASSEAGWL